MASPYTKTSIPERAIKLSSKFCAESPCNGVKEKLKSIVDYSKDEKIEMDKLNSKLSSYITRVQKLEIENKELIKEIEETKTNWGQQTQDIKDEYETVMVDIRNNIDTVAHLKTIADVSYKRATYDHAEHRRKIEENNLIVDYHTNRIKTLESELLQLKDSHACLLQATEAELALFERYKKNRDEALASLTDLLDKLDDELFKRIGVEYNNQTLREQLEFIWQINQREVCEMAQLSQALPFNEQIDFYKNQLKRVVSLIRRDYEQMHEEQSKKMEDWMQAKKAELENMYGEKDPIHDLEISMHVENSGLLKADLEANSKEIEELRREHEVKVSRLKEVEKLVDLEREQVSESLEKKQVEVGQINEELIALTNDYNHINVNKESLEYEISVYKRLVESQLSGGVSSVVTIKDEKPLKEESNQGSEVNEN